MLWMCATLCCDILIMHNDRISHMFDAGLYSTF